MSGSFISTLEAAAQSLLGAAQSKLPLKEEDCYWILLSVFFALGVVAFSFLQYVEAPYGRLFTRVNEKPKERRGLWERSLSFTVSSRSGWMIQESPAFLLFALCFLASPSRRSPAYLLLAFAFLLHYANRAFVYPLRMRSPWKPTPVVVVLLAFFFCTVNGYLCGRGLFYFSPSLPSNWHTSPQFLVGYMLWALGLGINLHSDEVLRSLRTPGRGHREEKEKRKEKGDYKIPYGGLFKYVSAANYFGEMVEWMGWAIAANNKAATVFALWTVANLLPRALQYHRWYLQMFEEYEKLNRRACIPFLL